MAELDGDEAQGLEISRSGSVDGSLVAAAGLVALAVEVLKKGGEEGVYWRDGRDLGEMWERVVGGRLVI